MVDLSSYFHDRGRIDHNFGTEEEYQHMHVYAHWSIGDEMVQNNWNLSIIVFGTALDIPRYHGRT